MSVEDDTTLPPPRRPAIVSRPARYCPACGSPWPADMERCLYCQSQAMHAPIPPARTTAPAAVTPMQGGVAGDLGSIKSSLALYFAHLAISMTLMLVGLFSRDHGEDFLTRLTFVGSALMALITVIWCAFSTREIAPLLSSPFKPHWIPGAAGMGVATFFVATSAVYLIRLIFMAGKEQPAATNSMGFGTAVFFVCVMPAVFEELAFRGFIQSALQRVLGNRDAILTMAFLFAILHLSIFSIPHLAIMGVVLGWLRWRTGSLYPGMVLHFTHNFLCVVAEQTARQ